MTLAKHKELVSRFYKAFNSDDADEFRAILSQHWKDHPEAVGQQPGPEGLIDVVGQFRGAFEGLHITPEHTVAEDDHVVVRIRLEGRHIKEFFWYSSVRQARRVPWDGHAQDRRRPDC